MGSQNGVPLGMFVSVANHGSPAETGYVLAASPSIIRSVPENNKVGIELFLWFGMTI